MTTKHTSKSTLKNPTTPAMSVELLEEIARYYDTTDTSALMTNGKWVDQKPMTTTSLRLPTEVIDRLKGLAAQSNVRYTSYVRTILEKASLSEPPGELRAIAERLDRIEAALKPKPNSKKAA